MHYYNHHIGDFIRDTARLSDAQSMAYLRLLWMYYESEGPLPDKPNVLALKIGSEQSTVALILDAFFVLDNGFWRHTRCDQEIQNYHTICKRNSENGKAGGRPKKTQWVSGGLNAEKNSEKKSENEQEKTQSVSSCNPAETQPKPHRNPNQYPITNNHDPITNIQYPETKNQESKKTNTQAKPAGFDPMTLELPECIKPAAWESWIKYRRQERLTCKEMALKTQLRNLESWWHDGHDPNAIIETSIGNGWQGLFAPKQGFGKPAAKQPEMTNEELAALICAEMRAEQSGGADHE